jgi:hypothetical protein
LAAYSARDADFVPVRRPAGGPHADGASSGGGIGTIMSGYRAIA